MLIHPTDSGLITKLQQSTIEVAGLRINFQRTCRVPEGKLNSLPAGLGSFPVYRVSDFKSGAPDNWRADGYFMPMYRQEAMWISFARGYMENPKALIVGAGNINAVSGKAFSGKEGIDVKLEKEQNYLVIPPQPWLDGWKAEDGKIYQFVAAELGSGETIEGQITGEEKIGGIQLIAYNPKPGLNLIPKSRPREYIIAGDWPGDVHYPNHPVRLRRMAFAATSEVVGASAKSFRIMGLGRGGEINQKVYPDDYGLETWEESPSAVDIVYLISSEDFRQVTGHNAPPTPVTHEQYQKQGLPWFELHDNNLGDSKGSDVFSKLKPVGEGKSPYLLDKLTPKE